MYTASNYSTTVASGESKTRDEFGGDWTAGNPNFSSDNSTHLKAKDMSQQQLNKSKFKVKENV